MNNKHIVKYAAVFIKDKRFLVVRQKGEDFWKNVGGKIENDETPEECLKREVKEELAVDLITTPEFYYSLPTTKAVSDPNVTLDIHLYRCETNQNPTPSQEIEELHWLTKEEFQANIIPLTSQIKEYIVPKLISDNLL